MVSVGSSHSWLLSARSQAPLRLLVTGGAGFIGSNFVEHALMRGHFVVVLDAFTYAGHAENLDFISRYPDCHVVSGRIQDSELVGGLLRRYDLDAVVNFAAESHVDRSIESPKAFMETNILGVFELLEASLGYYRSLEGVKKERFRFLQVSTDEVFGSLSEGEPKFSEATPYRPHSPYSASKAAADHLVRAWHHTFGLPTLTTNCSNNYGPRQFQEKLIPHIIHRAISGESLPIHGLGKNIRDWIFVQDHCEGVLLTLLGGRVGEVYCFGGRSERTNLEVVNAICDGLDSLQPRKDGLTYRTQVRFVQDRPGHDFHYAIDDSKAERELGFARSITRFEEGLRRTIEWYLANPEWSKKVLSKGTKITYEWKKADLGQEQVGH